MTSLRILTWCCVILLARLPEGLLSLLDRAPLNRRYWQSFALLGLVYVFDFFDFSLIAFIMAVIGPQWHLTCGQVALVFYGSGIGAILAGARSARCSGGGCRL